MTNLALSICVPVFNDEVELAKTLASLKEVFESRVSASQELIEVLISDNNSTDGSRALIEAFDLDSIPVRKFHQDNNLGFRANVEFLASSAAGEWTLFASCGDEFVSNFSFESAFTDLAATECDTAFFAFEMLDMLNGTYYRDGNSHKAFKAAQTEVIYSAAPMPFFRTAPLREVITSKLAISGDWWPQIEWALAASNVSGTAAYITPGPLTGNRPMSGWWTKPLAYMSVIELAKLLETLSLEHNSRSRLLADAKRTWTSLPGWVFQTKVVYSNRPSSRDYRVLASEFRNAPLAVFISFGVLICPMFLLNFARSASRVFKK